MNRRKKKDLQISLFMHGFVLLFLIVALLLHLFYGHRYGILSRFLFFVNTALVFLALLILYVMHAPSQHKNKWQSRLSLSLFFAGMAVLFFAGYFLKKIYVKQQLSAHGKTVSGKVTGYETESYKTSKSYFATIQYTIDGEVYVQKISNRDAFYKAGDTMELLVSENDPELFEVLRTYRNH